MSTNAQVNLNIDEAKDFLKHIVSNNRYLQESGKPAVAVEIIGESGIGKTSSVLQLANETGLSVVKLNLAQIEELGDLVGFPIRQFQLCKEGNGSSLKTITVEEKKMVPTIVKKMITENRQVQKQVMGADGKPVMRTVVVPVQVEKEVEEMVEEVVQVEKQVPAEGDQAECLWVDENAVEEYIKRGYNFTGNKQMAYCPPSWIADKQGGGFLILDDWNRADIRFIQAVMELK